MSIEDIRASLEQSESGHSAAIVEKAETDSNGMALVTELRHWSNPDYTRIAVILNRDAVFEYHRLKKEDSGKLPPRLYLDIKGARLARGVKDVSIGDGLLRMVRVGQFRPDIVRVVLDIDTMKDFKVFPLSDPYRIIIDVKGERQTEISSLGESIRTLPPSPHEEVRVPKTEEGIRPAPLFKPAKIRRIVIDPGHGGHDPGAIGANGTREKDVVLEMGLKLAKKIREDLHMDVVMTRSTDIFIPLEERTAIANKVNADLFVSVHANASLNRLSSGIETYYLNLAKTEKAKQVAARENNTSLEKVGVLQTILFDLMANQKLNDSARLADDVQSALYRRIGKQFEDAKNLGVKQGPFYVLVGATMPSILVETAFLSNDKEEERLKNPEYQDATVDGIVEGIKQYIAGLK
jgi:N-acetylmuramoyl-L-alanine amidase